jgi:hypothetical protein
MGRQGDQLETINQGHEKGGLRLEERQPPGVVRENVACDPVTPLSRCDNQPAFTVPRRLLTAQRPIAIATHDLDRAFPASELTSLSSVGVAGALAYAGRITTFIC